MRGWALWLPVVLGVILGFGVEASAEIYLWTDERGVVHMTNQWSNVPEAARSGVSMRESSATPSEGAPAREQATSPVEPLPIKQPSLQMPPDVAQVPPSVTPLPSIVPYPRESPVLIPNSRPFVHQPKKLSPPFPYNVRLDPFDPDFVWVGPNRVPKDTFTYPRVSLDTQAQFRNRLRALEQRRSTPPKTFPTGPTHP
jgi:Domain of unknown function (DUF4124)